jgi:hypothetical protein
LLPGDKWIDWLAACYLSDDERRDEAEAQPRGAQISESSLFNGWPKHRFTHVQSSLEYSELPICAGEFDFTGNSAPALSGSSGKRHKF